MPFTVRHTLHMHKSYYIPYTFWLKDLLQQSRAHHHHHHHHHKMCDCADCRVYTNRCACKGVCGDPLCRALQTDDVQCDWAKCKGHDKKHASQQFCRKCWKAKWPADWGITNAATNAHTPPPPAPVGKGGNHPPPGLDHSPLIDALRRIDQLERNHKDAADQIEIQSDHIKMLERKNKDATDQIQIQANQLQTNRDMLEDATDRCDQQIHMLEKKNKDMTDQIQMLKGEVQTNKQEAWTLVNSLEELSIFVHTKKKDGSSDLEGWEKDGEPRP